MTQHKWHKEILHWANGGMIESKWHGQDEWIEHLNPDWNDHTVEYRIKPEPKEPKFLYVYLNDNYEFSTILLENVDWAYVGKIKLEDE